MKLHPLLTFNALLFLIAGIAFTLYGPLMLAFFGVPEIPSEDILLYWNVAAFARLFGAALFGFGLLLWALRQAAVYSSLSSEARHGMVFALLLANIIAAITTITQQVSNWNGIAGWVAFSLFTFLVLGYAYCLVKGENLTESVA